MKNVKKMIQNGKITRDDINKATLLMKDFSEKKLPFERRNNFVNKKCSWEIIDPSNLKYYFLGLEIYSAHHINSGTLLPFLKDEKSNEAENTLLIIENKRSNRTIGVLYFEFRNDKEIIITELSLTGNILRNITKQTIVNWIEYMELEGFSVKIDEDYRYDFGKKKKIIENNNPLRIAKGYQIKMKDFYS